MIQSALKLGEEIERSRPILKHSFAAICSASRQFSIAFEFFRQRRRSTVRATSAENQTLQKVVPGFSSTRKTRMATKKQVLFLIFPNFNTLDLNGPQEVLKNYAMGATQVDQTFDISVAAACDITTAFEKVQVKRDISFDDALKSVSKFDLMLVAGGPPDDVQAAIDGTDGPKMLDLIEAFASQRVNSESPKWLISICTGAGFLATCGLFGGKTVTTHFGYITTLQGICAKYSKEKTTVVRERWVNAGVLDGGVKLVTSGGVSCGIDCVLWVVGEIVGMDSAKSVASMMDYDWIYTRPNQVTVGWTV